MDLALTMTWNRGRKFCGDTLQESTIYSAGDLSLQVFIYTDEIPHESSLLQVKQSQLFQSFFTGVMLQSFYHLSDHLLESHL